MLTGAPFSTWAKVSKVNIVSIVRAFLFSSKCCRYEKTKTVKSSISSYLFLKHAEYFVGINIRYTSSVLKEQYWGYLWFEWTLFWMQKCGKVTRRSRANCDHWWETVLVCLVVNLSWLLQLYSDKVAFDFLQSITFPFSTDGVMELFFMKYLLLVRIWAFNCFLLFLKPSLQLTSWNQQDIFPLEK